MNNIILIKADITKLNVDAIVNAANSGLGGGGGVDGAIHRAAGPEIHMECMDVIAKIGRLPAGEAVITEAGLMPSKYVIHTVGPVWRGGMNNEPELLANCYTNSLQLAEENGCRSIAFPNISTGIYGYPLEKAAMVAVKSVIDYLTETKSGMEITFCCFEEENYRLYNDLLK